jgi:hypothetical protein
VLGYFVAIDGANTNNCNRTHPCNSFTTVFYANSFDPLNTDPSNSCALSIGIISQSFFNFFTDVGSKLVLIYPVEESDLMTTGNEHNSCSFNISNGSLRLKSLNILHVKLEVGTTVFANLCGSGDIRIIDCNVVGSIISPVAAPFIHVTTPTGETG